MLVYTYLLFMALNIVISGFQLGDSGKEQMLNF